MVKYFWISIVISVTLSCRKDNVEIYLLNERVGSSVGVPLKQTKYYRKVDAVHYQDELDGAYFDTVSKEYIFAGRFDADKDDLQKKPFIKNNDIISFNLETHEIEFTAAAAEKIIKIGNTGRLGIQFVIAVNKNPAIEGYFMHRLAAGPCHWYCISYVNPDEPQTTFELENGYMRGKHEDLTPPYPFELIEAFRSSGRLIE